MCKQINKLNLINLSLLLLTIRVIRLRLLNCLGQVIALASGLKSLGVFNHLLVLLDDVLYLPLTALPWIRLREASLLTIEEAALTELFHLFLDKVLPDPRDPFMNLGAVPLPYIINFFG